MNNDTLVDLLSSVSGNYKVCIGSDIDMNDGFNHLYDICRVEILKRPKPHGKDEEIEIVLVKKG